jgi:hypothetical protein
MNPAKIKPNSTNYFRYLSCEKSVFAVTICPLSGMMIGSRLMPLIPYSLYLITSHPLVFMGLLWDFMDSQ